MDPATSALLQTLLNGAVLGCLFGAISLGLTVKWGLLGIPDLSHFSLVLVGAYFAYTLTVEWGLNPLLAGLVAVPVFALFGTAIQYFMERAKAEEFTAMLLTFGIFIVMESAVSLLWSPDVRSLRGDLPDWLRDRIPFPAPLDRLSLSGSDVLIIVTSVAMVLVVTWMLRRTRHGRAVLAMRKDPQMASAFGARVLPLSLGVSAVAAASAAIAGSMVAIKMPLFPQLPMQWIGIVVVACLLGGMGLPLGGLVAAALVLMTQNVWSLYFEAQWAPAIAYGILFLYLALRPLTRVLRRPPRTEVTA